MPAPRFVHLRLHSEYSITDSVVRIEAAVARAAADGMAALALTDSANLFGMVKFYGAARAAGVKPIVGADCWLQNDADREKPYRLLLLCASQPGYRRLCELLTRAWLKNAYRGRGEIAPAWFEELGTDGLIALSGFAAGDVGHALAAGQDAAAERLARAWAQRFPGRYYLEIQRAGAPPGEALVARTLALAGAHRLAGGRDAPGAVSRARGLQGARGARVHRRTATRSATSAGRAASRREQYFKTQQEMARLFADVPQALENAVEIARRCNLETRTRPQPPARVSDAGRRRRRALSARAGRARARRAPCAAFIRIRLRRAAEAPRYARAPGIRARDHRRDGVSRATS
ncbi:MAG: PHP domain-containing protein [Burkholderiales bacterium]|nr:PHP domain-containing protein [Burkholderiales bacterium]